MIVEVLALGVLSGVRPATSQAAVVALLNTAEPRRLLLLFTLSGFAVSFVLGVGLVATLHGVGVDAGGSSFFAAIELIAGVAALSFAAGLQRGGSIPWRRGTGATRGAGMGARLAHRVREPSPRVAAAAGVLTHLPGLIYLVALNAIAATDPAPAEGVASVAIYNLLWFAMPLAALGLAIFRPDTARDLLRRLTAWSARHEAGLAITVFAALGVYLTVKGAWNLLD